MRKLTARFAVLTLVAGAFGMVGPATAVGDKPKNEGHGTVVSVLGTGDRVTLSRSILGEGRITFKVATSSAEGSSITLFRLVGGATLAKFKADLAEEFSENPLVAAKGTRDLKRDARFFGLAQVKKTTPAEVTTKLAAGTYYLMDLNNGPGPTGPRFTTLTVRKPHGGSHAASDSGAERGGHDATVKMTSDKRFDSPKVLPANGTVRVRNAGNTIHFMAMEPVKKGTTDAQIQQFFDSNFQSPPPFLDTPSVGLDVLSPGKRAELTYKVRPGTYVLMCFVADEKTGIPHALMGMHKVVTVK